MAQTIGRSLRTALAAWHVGTVRLSNTGSAGGCPGNHHLEDYYGRA